MSTQHTEQDLSFSYFFVKAKEENLREFAGSFLTSAYEVGAGMEYDEVSREENKSSRTLHLQPGMAKQFKAKEFALSPADTNLTPILQVAQHNANVKLEKRLRLKKDSENRKPVRCTLDIDGHREGKEAIFVNHPESGAVTCHNYPYTGLPTFTTQSADPGLLAVAASQCARFSRGHAQDEPDDADILYNFSELLITLSTKRVALREATEATNVKARRAAAIASRPYPATRSRTTRQALATLEFKGTQRSTYQRPAIPKASCQTYIQSRKRKDGTQLGPTDRGLRSSYKKTTTIINTLKNIYPTMQAPHKEECISFSYQFGKTEAEKLVTETTWVRSVVGHQVLSGMEHGELARRLHESLNLLNCTVPPPNGLAKLIPYSATEYL
ncbi:hypothetical protein CYLTODRAFT_481116 [Cylindrobasidium torrendii FP15055 ss-10]|uniref:Uncharacterized protein n=1 Tax=Cylindrobasidium torrendii FP15055 ss-10 TaxID=1314674 RepID=A0A0D7ASI1_9AGAR|nr:hypothetical protein CYLTODRAFT_481116 [Cylindrobasidium torrendii FP15055 ss-10]